MADSSWAKVSDTATRLAVAQGIGARCIPWHGAMEHFHEHMMEFHSRVHPVVLKRLHLAEQELIRKQSDNADILRRLVRLEKPTVGSQCPRHPRGGLRLASTTKTRRGRSASSSSRAQCPDTDIALRVRNAQFIAARIRSPSPLFTWPPPGPMMEKEELPRTLPLAVLPGHQ